MPSRRPCRPMCAQDEIGRGAGADRAAKLCCILVRTPSRLYLETIDFRAGEDTRNFSTSCRARTSCCGSKGQPAEFLNRCDL